MRKNANRKNERGNIFFTLFGAVAVVGVLGATTVTMMKGPLTTMVEVNRRTMADTQMQIASKLALLTASMGPYDGDCEASDNGTPGDPSDDIAGDLFVEPIEWEGSGVGPGAVTGSDGGGWLPSSVGASQADPWGTRYGYCVWDAGTIVDHVDCGGGTQNRLEGSGGSDKNYPIIAIISAGPDRVFDTGCETFASADTAGNGNGAFDPDTETMITKPSDSDDIVLALSYAEAATSSNGMWTLSPSSPEIATINKGIEVEQGGAFGGAVVVDPSVTDTNQFPYLAADYIDAVTTGGTPELMSGFNLGNTGVAGSECTNLGQFAVDDLTHPSVLLMCVDIDTGAGVDMDWIGIAGVGAGGKWSDATGGINYAGGNVGIANATPGQALDVTGNIALTLALMMQDGQPVQWGSSRIAGVDTGALTLSTTSGTIEMSNAGDVGLGIAPTAATKLFIKGDAATTNLLEIHDDGDTDVDFIIQDDGDVGIGVDDPDDKLQVSGSVDLSDYLKVNDKRALAMDDAHGLGTVYLGFDVPELTGTTGVNNTVIGTGSGLLIDAGTANTILGQGSAIALTGSENTILGVGAGITIDDGTNNILIGTHSTVPVDVIDNTNDSYYLNIGNSIFGWLDEDGDPADGTDAPLIGINVPDPDATLDVGGDMDVTGRVDITDGSLYLSNTEFGLPPNCSGSGDVLQWTGTTWDCATETNPGDSTGTDDQNLTEVLGEGQDGGGNNIHNIGNLYDITAAYDIGKIRVGTGGAGTEELEVVGDGFVSSSLRVGGTGAALNGMEFELLGDANITQTLHVGLAGVGTAGFDLDVSGAALIDKLSVNDADGPDDASGSGGQELFLDVNGAIGGSHYCDPDGGDCFTAANIAALAGGGITVPGDTDDILFNNADALGVDTDQFVYQAATNELGIGIADPTANIHVQDATPELRLTDADDISDYLRIHTPSQAVWNIDALNDLVIDATRLTLDTAGGDWATGINFQSSNLHTSGSAGTHTARPFNFSSGWAPVEGTGSFEGMRLEFDINQTGTNTGDYSILDLNVTETSLLAGSDGYLADFAVDGTTVFQVDRTGMTSVGHAGRAAVLDADSTDPENVADALLVPRGTTAEQPGATDMAAAADGMIRYNTTDGDFEVRVAGVWRKLVTGAAGGSGASHRIEDETDQDTYVDTQNPTDGSDDDIIRFGTAGAERMTIDANGKVRINRPMVGESLEVVGISRILRLRGENTQPYLQVRNSNGAYVNFGQPTGDDHAVIQVGKGAGTALSIMTFHNNLGVAEVGIGTADPKTALDVTGTLRVGDGGEACDVADHVGGIRFDGTKFQVCAVAGAGAGQGWQDMVIGSLADFTSLGDTPDDYSGSANYLLRVKSDLSGLEFVDAGTVSAASGHRIEDETNGNTFIDTQASDGTDDDIIRFGTAGTERMTINASGTVAIPSGLRITNGDARSTFELYRSGNSRVSFAISDGLRMGSSAGFQWYPGDDVALGGFHDNSKRRMELTSGGLLGIGTTWNGDTIESRLHLQDGEIRLDGGTGNEAGCFRFDDSAGNDVLQFAHDCSTWQTFAAATAGGASGNRIEDATDGDTFVDTQNPSDGTDDDIIRFGTAGEERMVIDSGGNIILGNHEGTGEVATRKLIQVRGELRIDSNPLNEGGNFVIDMGNGSGKEIYFESNGTKVSRIRASSNDYELDVEALGSWDLNLKALSNVIKLDTNRAVILPSGPTTDRPGEGSNPAAAEGMIRYNETTHAIEVFAGDPATWEPLTVDSSISSDRIFDSNGGDTSIETDTASDGSANTIVFNTDSSERMRILATGEVGVGTDAPDAKMHVAGTTDTALTGTVAVNGTTAVTGTGTQFNTELNVGDAITIAGETFTVAAIGSNTSLTLDEAHTQTASGETATVDGDLLALDTGDAARKFIVDKSGNVGIGTDTPGAALTLFNSVQGHGYDISVDNTGQSGAPSIRFRRTDVPNGTIYFDISTAGGAYFNNNVRVTDSLGIGGQSILNAGGNSDLKIHGGDAANINRDIFFQNGDGTVTIATMKASGLVGIGVTDPKTRLHVAGNILLGNNDACDAADKHGALRVTGGDTLEMCMDDGAGGHHYVDITGGASGSTAFINLSDTPSAYAGSAADAYKALMVNAAGDGVQFADVSALLLPAGQNSDRPTGAAGMLRYNTETDAFEVWDENASGWADLVTGVGGLWTDSGSGYIEYDNALGGIKIGSKTGAAPTFPTVTVGGGGGAVGTIEEVLIAGSNANTQSITGLSNVTLTGSLTVGDNSLVMDTNTAGHILVGDNANFSPVAMSGDASLTSTGAITIADNAVTSAKIAADTIVAGDIATGAVTADEILDATILEADLNISNAESSGFCLTSDGAGGFTWANCGTNSAFTDLTDTPDVATMNASTGQFVKVNGAGNGLIFSDQVVNVVSGTPSPTGLSLNDLENVNSSPSEDQVLTWSGSQWIAQAVGSGGITDDSLDWAQFANAMTLDENTTVAMNDLDLNFDSDTFVIDSSEDRVGIGTSAPRTRLHVSGSVLLGDGGEACNTGETDFPGAIRYANDRIEFCKDYDDSTPDAWVPLTDSSGAVDALDDLSDVTISDAALNEVLVNDGAGQWVDQLMTFDILGDTPDSAAMSASTGQFVKVNGAGNGLIFSDQVVEIGAGAEPDRMLLNDLGNVNASPTGADEVLTWSGSQWIAQAVGGSLWTELSSTRIHFGSAGTEQVGIGTNNPLHALHVVGDIRYTGTSQQLSDRRYKESIAPLREYGDVMDRLEQIETYSFTMKNDPKARVQFGVIAQELEQVFPELVTTDNDEMGTKAVNYVGLIAPVIEATKALKAENEALKAELASYKAGQQDMMETVAAMKRDVDGLKAQTGYGFDKAGMNIAWLVLLFLAGGGAGVLISRRRPSAGVK